MRIDRDVAHAALREQVEGLLTRMTATWSSAIRRLHKIAELLPQAVGAMKDIEGKLTLRRARSSAAARRHRRFRSSRRLRNNIRRRSA